MLILAKDISTLNRLKKDLSESFEMKDLRSAKQIIGMCVIRDMVITRERFSRGT